MPISKTHRTFNILTTTTTTATATTTTSPWMSAGPCSNPSSSCICCCLHPAIKVLHLSCSIQFSPKDHQKVGEDLKRIRRLRACWKGHLFGWAFRLSSCGPSSAKSCSDSVLCPSDWHSLGHSLHPIRPWLLDIGRERDFFARIAKQQSIRPQIFVRFSPRQAITKQWQDKWFLWPCFC